MQHERSFVRWDGKVMAKKLDKILVIDLEATCWEGDPPPGQVSLCVLDIVTGERSTPRAIMVKPQQSTLSDYCIELTTITPKMLTDGLDFTGACALLEVEYQGAPGQVTAITTVCSFLSSVRTRTSLILLDARISM